MGDDDPTVTDPDKYSVIFENERVRVLDYRDRPGQRTSPHRHPASVMYTLSDFRRLLGSGARSVEIEKQAGEVNWLDAQEHFGENTGVTDTHVIFVELKDTGGQSAGTPYEAGALGPAPR